MVNLDCSLIVAIVLALFGVEAIAEDILWDRQADNNVNSYNGEFMPPEGAANDKTYDADTRRVTQLVDTPEDALNLMDAMKSRERRRMNPFSALRGKRTFSPADESLYPVDNSRRSQALPYVYVASRGKRMVVPYSPFSELRNRLFMEKLLQAAMSLSGNQKDDDTNVGKRTFGFHALRGR